MNRCEPAEMRKNLIAVEAFANHGLDFVAVPVTSPEHKKELLKQADDTFNELIKGAGYER